jgi:hypothetical protein
MGVGLLSNGHNSCMFSEESPGYQAANSWTRQVFSFRGLAARIIFNPKQKRERMHTAGTTGGPIDSTR